ncbi:MAG: RNA polymerase sigma factor [Planctomycetota bacterium]|nr:RNA polymerase sigma factor [Planctomycetota bacterium]
MNTSLESDALAIFQRHRREVYRWAFRVLGNHHDTLDVTQDVFLKWIEKMQIVPPVNARAWLRTVTTNRAIDLLRSKKHRVSSSHEPDRIENQPENYTDRQALRHEIAHAMEQLSEQQRAVLIAKVYDGMTFAAIGEELDIAIPTAKTHYLRALRVVREKISQDWLVEGDA